MKKFRLTFEEGLGEDYGISMISMVNDPATKHLYVSLKEEERIEVFLSADKKKGTVTGALMVPDLEITRFDPKTQEPYKIEFPAETIELASQDFMKKNLGHSINIEHSLGVEEVYVTEAWIKADEVHDKSVALGVTAPVGSMMVTLKVDNEEVRKELVDTGLLTGFSIEGLFKRELIEDTVVTLSNENNQYMKTNEKSVLTKIRELLTGSEEVELESKVAEVSYWWQDVVNDTFELDTQIMRKPYSEDDEPYPLSAGEYTLEDERKVLVDSEGYIRYFFPTVKEEEVEPAEAAETVTETPANEEATEEVAASTQEAPVETVAEPVVETPVAEAQPTVAEVVEKIEEKVADEVPMIPHTDAVKPKKVAKPKWDSKLTMQERIKSNLAQNLQN